LIYLLILLELMVSRRNQRSQKRKREQNRSLSQRIQLNHSQKCLS